MSKIGPIIVLILFFMIGFLGIFFPYKIQRSIVCYYARPRILENKIPLYRNKAQQAGEFVKKPIYIVYLRLIGLASLIAGGIGVYFLFFK